MPAAVFPYMAMKIEHNQLIDVYVGSPTPDAIECRSTIPTWAPIFEEHFPEHPILPGALMVEIMAQAGGFICLLKSNFERRARLTSVQSAKFKAYAQAGEDLLIRAQATHWGDGLVVCDGQVAGADGRPMANATFTLKFEPFASDRRRHACMALLPKGLSGSLRQSGQLVSSPKEFVA